MNRLILVGNGFDLAHGLRTSYKNFIDDFWENRILELEKNNFRNYKNELFNFYQNRTIYTDSDVISDFNSLINHPNYSVEFSNLFLEAISKKCYDNWVDIEKEYYEDLKRTLNKKYYRFDVNKLNNDFAVVKDLLIKYLLKIEKPGSINNSICNKIYSYFKLSDFSFAAINEKVKIEYEKLKTTVDAVESGEISLSEIEDDEEKKLVGRLIGADKKSVIKDLLEYPNQYTLRKFDMYPKEVLFLNFNYTDTILNYIINTRCNTRGINVNFNNIHGNLIEAASNPIIFGFGDDVDDKYKEFEDLDDNRYLANFKSIAYSQTDNYKRLLEFINSNSYQVFIFGHSCGISDRTMLNTIFEHDNCKSIKPFYYKKVDGSDNYTEIVQNISRNFNNKKKFRDRVVNKTYCEPLT